MATPVENYAKLCVSCHDLDGHANGPAGTALKAGLPGTYSMDLPVALKADRYKGEPGKKVLLERIQKGTAGRPLDDGKTIGKMPPVGGGLSADEATALMQYVLSTYRK